MQHSHYQMADPKIQLLQEAEKCLKEARAYTHALRICYADFFSFLSSTRIPQSKKTCKLKRFAIEMQKKLEHFVSSYFTISWKRNSLRQPLRSPPSRVTLKHLGQKTRVTLRPSKFSKAKLKVHLPSALLTKSTSKSAKRKSMTKKGRWMISGAPA